MTAARPPLVVWRFVDGKPGHEKQSAGLLQGIEALRAVEVHEFDMRFKALLARQLRARLLHRPADVPDPELLIGVGHSTHVPLLIARLVFSGKSVVLMKPSLPHRWFDLLFVPQHDRYRHATNVVETRGVICPTTEREKEPCEGLILLGGPSPHFVWSDRHVCAELAAIARASPKIQWQVCDSRRTPSGLSELMTKAPNLGYRHWKSAPADFLEKTLATARYVWVTADSASMLYESLSACARVGVIDLALKKPSRGNKHVRGIGLLRSQGHIHLTTDGYGLDRDIEGPHFFPENHRCAKIALDRLVGQ